MTEIAMVPVSSSNIAAIGYDEAENTLRVSFKSDNTYDYYGVPPFLYARLMDAPSHGKFLNAEIIGKYRDSRIG